ncbi:CLUMA_CG013927, isoform A [Clunio marinus]|uniref:CLUMA_CG013927, isoform A n=1 Tax=Clunio marinus TaxID=568069 RepID=A0A1J1IKA7_9DIPT|nr:CLUMA_CG013927, isoform A [Clunio marinus]
MTQKCSTIDNCLDLHQKIFEQCGWWRFGFEGSRIRVKVDDLNLFNKPIYFCNVGESLKDIHRMTLHANMTTHVKNSLKLSKHTKEQRKIFKSRWWGGDLTNESGVRKTHATVSLKMT